MGKSLSKSIQSTDDQVMKIWILAQSAQTYLSVAFDLDEKCGGLGDLKSINKLLDKFSDQHAKPEINTEQNAGDQSPT